MVALFVTISNQAEIATCNSIWHVSEVLIRLHSVLVALQFIVSLSSLLSLHAVLIRGPLHQNSPGAPTTVPFDTNLRMGSDDLPLDYLAKKGGLFEPEQIHLAYAGMPDIPLSVYAASITNQNNCCQFE